MNENWERIRFILVFIIGCIFAFAVKVSILLLLWNNIIRNIYALPFITTIQMSAVVFGIDLLRSNFNVGNVLDLVPKNFMQICGYELQTKEVRFEYDENKESEDNE